MKRKVMRTALLLGAIVGASEAFALGLVPALHLSHDTATLVMIAGCFLIGYLPSPLLALIWFD